MDQDKQDDHRFSAVGVSPSVTRRFTDGAGLVHPLKPVLDAVIHQATQGKGVRHGGDSTPFLEQPWVHYGRLHGRGFLTGQAAKKLEEAANRLSGEAFEHEVLGAICYCAMAVLHERERQAANRTIEDNITSTFGELTP